MAKGTRRKPASKLPVSDRGVAVSHYKPIPWMATPGMYIAGREALDGADAAGVEMERKWGVGRLRLLVSGDLREKFDRQRYLTNQARWSGELEDVRREASRMAKAWVRLDKAAEDAGAKPLSPTVWEYPATGGILAGSVIAIVKEHEGARAVKETAEGRNVIVYTLEEVVQMICADHLSLTVKQTFPGAEIVPARQKVKDPFETPLYDTDEGIFDTTAPIDSVQGFEPKVQELNDDVPF